MSNLDSAIELMDRCYDAVKRTYVMDDNSLDKLYHLIHMAKLTEVEEEIPRFRIDVLGGWNFNGHEIRTVKCYENGTQIEGIKELDFHCDMESLPKLTIVKELRQLWQYQDLKM